MSKVSVREVTCPNCKEELEVKVYDSINELFDSELIEKLLKNELNVIYCECGKKLTLRYPMLYHKMGIGKSVMIHYTEDSIEQIREDHEIAKSYLGGGYLLEGMKNNLKTIGYDTEDVLEAYNNWELFLNRVKEISYAR